MRLRHDARDVEADAHPGKGAGAPRAADEGMTELRNFPRRDADALVRNCDLGALVICRERNTHRSAGRRVLHRVADEVHEELLDAGLVPVGGEVGGGLHREGVAPSFGSRVDVALDDVAKHEREVVRHPLHAQGPLLRT